MWDVDFYVSCYWFIWDVKVCGSKKGDEVMSHHSSTCDYKILVNENFIFFVLINLDEILCLK